MCFFVQVCVEYFRSGFVVAFCAAAPFEGGMLGERLVWERIIYRAVWGKKLGCRL